MALQVGSLPCLVNVILPHLITHLVARLAAAHALSALDPAPLCCADAVYDAMHTALGG
jgi:hypothetical protein